MIRRSAPGRAAFLLALAALIGAGGLACRRPAAASSAPPMIGVKIYERDGAFPELFEEWRALGINTAFVSAALASDPGFRGMARTNGIALYIILPTFYRAEALAAEPGLAAITADGTPARDEWVEFICPSREDYRSRHAAYVMDLVRSCDPDGISLDFIRGFVFWEKVYPERDPETLPRTCFCPSCLDRFQRETGLRLQDGLEGTAQKARWILSHHPREWTDWRCGLIASLVEALAGEARRVKPGIKVNVHAVPWREADFGGAVRSVAAQDLPRIARAVDYVQPMCYHHMVLRTPDWVHAVVEDFAARAGTPVVPSIQVGKAYIDKELAPDEFAAALREALRPPSAGVVFWNWDALAASPAKKAIVKRDTALK